MSGGQGAPLRVTGLTRVFGSGETAVRALDGVSFDVAPGEFLAVRGRSGSGKTTLLNVIGGLDKATEGRVTLGDSEITAMSEKDVLGLRRERVSYIFQGFGLIPVLTARENVGVPLRLLEVPSAEREQRVAEMLDRVGLSGHVNQRPAELSGGQQQRAGIARALVSHPELLLADEPTGQLDSHTAREIMELIASLVHSTGMTAIVTTHDPILLSLADRVLQIADGRFVDQMSTEPPARQ